MSSASRASDERSGSSDSGSQTRHVHVSDLTLDVGGAGKKPLEPPPEAAIILISHPQGEGLGTRWPIREGSVLEIGRSGGRDISLPDAL